MSDSIVYLDRDQLIYINNRLVEAYNEKQVLQHPANLDFLIEQVKHYGESNHGKDGRLFAKAGYLLYHLAFDMHIFGDGNKRTTLIATTVFLWINGYFFEGDSSEDVETTIMEAAKGKRKIAALSKWLRRHSTKQTLGQLKITIGADHPA